MGRLDIIYEKLDFKNGALYFVTDDPSQFKESIDWLEKGEWLAAAKRAGAEKIFFVDNNPVVVFAECDSGEEAKIKAFNRAWCLARPRLLFLASPGEISVYDLARKPVNEKKPEDWKNLESLDVLYELDKVTRELQEYHRDNVESGRLFADKQFGDLNNRADKALIRDLKIVRRELIRAGLSADRVRFAHALIGRSIFIRCLEDRGILTKEYFLNVAGKNQSWKNLLENPGRRAGIDLSNRQTGYYPRILSDKEFTYALFRKLAEDFNGDMFPDVDEEERVVTQEHLKLIQDLLYGDAGEQKKLFFYSYNFDIVPLDLISSIYEEFYHISTSDDEKSSRKRQDGVYYTPPVLVEFVLSHILTPDVIDKKPRVLDPACGSGIFLVEAFRRIVRYNRFKNERQPTFDELKLILKEQIAGMEVNEEAARITAFSLYLSMLHYLDPPSITRQIEAGNRLPNLLATKNGGGNCFQCILPGDAFDTAFIESNPDLIERFGKECADVVVGNPPWGAPGKKADQKTKNQHRRMIEWCKVNEKPIGDKEPSQAFLWRALEILKENGKLGMLVSAGVLFKHDSTSQTFREKLFECIRLTKVFNFSHVRKFFFKGAFSPFLAIFFSRAEQTNHPVYYRSAKQAISINKTQAIAFSRYDLNILSEEDLANTVTWKKFYFGRSADGKFLRFLQKQKTLKYFCDSENSGRGFQISNKAKDAGFLKSFKLVDIDRFSRYDPLGFKRPPDRVEHHGKISIYNGLRILVKRGIQQKSVDKGRIISRLETDPFCFTNDIHGIKLTDQEEWKYKTILGILWSSVARYFFFMTTANWGLWHHEIHLDDELLQLPIVLDKSNPVTGKVISIVDKLRSYHPQEQELYHHDGVSRKQIEVQRREWETELDKAVFELYGLNEEQIDLIRDFCAVTLPFFYTPFSSNGTERAVENNDSSWIKRYIHTFCRRWNIYLDDDEEMRAEIHIGAHDNIAAVEFFPAEKSAPWNLETRKDSWSYILEQIGKSLPQPMGTSQILSVGLVYIVSDPGIIIIKRNEKRFWTSSLAREDADATICQRMYDTMPQAKEK